MRRPRARRTDLEAALADCVIEAVKETNPELRDAIRAALDKGASPAYIIQRWGKRRTSIAWIVDEWQREKGLVKPDESIDRVQ